MKAIRVHEFGGPEVLTLEEIPDPECGAGQVLVRIQAVGVNPVETYIRGGAYARLPDLPYTPGGDAAGVVEAIGDGVRRVAKGDRVYIAGGIVGAYAEMAVREEIQVHRLPGGASFAQGAAVGVPCGTAYRALFNTGEAEPGEILLVHGASGAVGIAAVQLAVARGIRVVGTAGTDRGRKLVEDNGAELVLDHTAPDYLDELMEWSGGHGADVIVEMLANVNLDRDLGVVARFGRVVVVGNRGRVEIDARQTMGKDASIRGLTLGNATPAESASIHAALGAALGNGTLSPVINREMPLAEAAAAHVAVMEPGAYGKIVLTP